MSTRSLRSYSQKTIRDPTWKKSQKHIAFQEEPKIEQAAPADIDE